MSAPPKDEARARPRITAEDALPGDPDRDELVARMIRVDQAGEYGAVRIYEGQLAVLRGTVAGREIEGMLAQEHEHLAAFNEMIAERRVRPTALQPLWHMAGFALGAGSALLGERAAMATTVAVEEVIEDHYQRQLDALAPELNEESAGENAELQAVIAEFREDELKHRDLALENGAEEAPAYQILSQSVKAGTRLAIWLAERI